MMSATVILMLMMRRSRIHQIHQMEKKKRTQEASFTLSHQEIRASNVQVPPGRPNLSKLGIIRLSQVLGKRSPWHAMTHMCNHESFWANHLALPTIQIQVKLPANLLDSWTFCSISTCPHILQSPSTSSFTHHVLISHIYQVSIVIVVSPTTRNKGGSLKPPSPNRFQAPTELLPRLLEAPPEALLRCDSVESRCSRDSRDTAMLEMARRRSSTSERRRRRDKGFLWLHWFWMVLARWRLGEEFLGILDHERLMMTWCIVMWSFEMGSDFSGWCTSVTIFLGFSGRASFS